MADGEAGSTGSLIERSPSRAAIQRYLERSVLENRMTIAVVFPAVGAVTLVASAEGWLPEPLAFNPLLILFGTLVMRSPLLVGIAPRVGTRALVLLSAVTCYTWAIELIGVRTDWPYGAFEYGVRLGPMLFESIPLALPLFFVPLALNAYLLSLLVLGERASSSAVRIPLAIGAVVAVDLVLDPAAVAVGFWHFEDGGFYYDVPVSNYLGWVLSATVAVVLVDLAFDRRRLIERVDECPFVLDDLVSFVVLWGLINTLYMNVIPALIAVGFGLALHSTGRYEIPIDDPRAGASRWFDRR
ncbi:bisanhydrobacterioruberin hydratase [Halovivax gelatinilyticus]|uniref:bisanhydrobacterioruberin hydratase n=1 Tax=Halovivax gelatinilyticus TaxID=2961597 RepID=UPI0020CA61D6|nr:bisanhydrobacterioruberin hydratase [Halovivax gelatinilyticus]